MKTRVQSGFTLIEIMIVVALIGLLAAIAVPSFRRAIDKTQRQACALNRKNIDAAKLQWSVDGKASPDEVPADADLFGAGRYIEDKPECPAGGQYTLRAVSEKCTCSVPAHAN